MSATTLYEARAYIQDSFEKVYSAVVTIPTAEVIMDFNADGTGGGIGMYTQKAGQLDIAWDIVTHGSHMQLDTNGLRYFGPSGNVTGEYPASGPAQARGTATSNGGTKTITFSGNSLAIIGALGSTGNTYGMWTYTGYGAGTARQHINPILGPGSGISCTIDGSTQSVTITNSTTANCGIYVWMLFGPTPTIT